MSTKVEQSSNYGAVASSSATASGVKISKFATKSGFLIPKNKLSGSLIPIIRGGKKGRGDVGNEENVKQVQRKTKWGPDLTQDATVRKGRAIAYQTRIDQITQELRLGKLETDDNHNLSSTYQIQDHSSDHQLNSQDLEVLELERCEAIGELLKLNPSYKPPAGYKPLLKVAKVPIPVKEYPAYSIVGLVLGPANDTQKRLEKETGAKIRVYGTKADTGLEVEVTSTDGDDIHGGYNELHVHISADAYEKVDAAVALIELLFMPVSGTSASVSITSAAVSGDNVNVTAPNLGTAGMPAAVASGRVAQPMIQSGPAAQQNRFQQDGPSWFSIGATQTAVIPSSGFAALANLSAPLTSNPLQLLPSLFNPSTMSSIFGPRPVVSAGFSAVPQSPSLVPSGPHLPQVLQHPYMSQPPPFSLAGTPRNMFMPVSQPTHIQSNITPPQLTSNQATAVGPAPVVRPIMSSLPESSLSASFSDQPPIPANWSKAPLDNTTSMGPGNIMPEAPKIIVPWGHPAMASHPSVASGAPPPNISPISQPSTSHLAGAAVNHSSGVPFFNSSSQSQMGISPSLLPSTVAAPTPFQVPSPSIAPIQTVMPQVLMPNSSRNPVPGSTLLSSMTSTSTPLPVPSGVPISGSGGAVSFNPLKPLFMTGLRPQQPSSSDFTFQPHRPQNPEFEAANRPETRPILVHPNQPVMPPQGSQTPFIQPALHDLRHPPIARGFSRPNIGSQIMQPIAQTSMNFASSLAVTLPPRHATFPNSTAAPSMQPRNFNSAPPFVNATVPRAGIPMQIQQNYPAAAARPQSFGPPNQHFNNNISFARPSASSSGVQQVYDPFTPTSVSRNPQLSSNRTKNQKQDNDPEYEDLMASVGVK